MLTEEATNHDIFSIGLLAACGGWIVKSFTYLIGGFDNYAFVLAVFIAIDFITYFIFLWDAHLMSANGLLHKLRMYTIVFLAIIMSFMTDILIGDEKPEAIRNIVILCSTAAIGISALDSMRKMGFKAPRVLKDMLETFNVNRIEDEEDDHHDHRRPNQRH